MDHINWDFLHLESDINSLTDTFYSKLNKILFQEVPARKYFSHSFPQWYNSQLKKKIFQKKDAHCKLKETDALEDYFKFTRLRALCIRLSRSFHKSYLEYIAKQY